MGPVVHGYGPSFNGDGQSMKKLEFVLMKLMSVRDGTVETMEMKAALA